MSLAVYFDSSALAKLILTEAESDVLHEYFVGTENPVSSALAAMEVMRAVRRSDPGAAGRVVEELEGLQLIEVDDGVLEEAARIDPPELRSPDALHLASALQLGRDLSVLVTYDARLTKAASRIGVPVESPS